MDMKPDPKLLAKWEAILRAEGLGMSRGGRVLARKRILRDEDTIVCAGCRGVHTQDETCGYRDDRVPTP